jgi:hypothetical protein
MYLLDTDVLSELRKIHSGKGNQSVAAWFHGRPLDSIYLSVINIMELRLGVVGLTRYYPIQAAIYQSWLEAVLQMGFATHILPVDLPVALKCGELHVPDRRPFRDALLGATALVHRLTVVTGNVKDFAPMGVAIINPWD